MSTELIAAIVVGSILLYRTAMTISLSDLKAKRSAMAYDGSTELLIEQAVAERNATGVIATHAAADVIIEIAEAARGVLEMFDDPNTEPWHGVAGADARAILRAALAKVRP